MTPVAPAGPLAPLVVLPDAPPPTVVVDVDVVVDGIVDEGVVVDDAVDGALVSLAPAAGGTTTVSFFWQAVSANAASSAVAKSVFFMMLPFVDSIGRRLVRPWWTLASYTAGLSCSTTSNSMRSRTLRSGHVSSHRTDAESHVRLAARFLLIKTPKWCNSHCLALSFNLTTDREVCTSRRPWKLLM